MKKTWSMILKVIIAVAGAIAGVIGVQMCIRDSCGGARMVIEDGVNGFLIPVNNQKSLVEIGRAHV